VLLRYVVFFRSRQQVLKSRTPHSGARPETLRSGAQIRKTEETPPSAIGDLKFTTRIPVHTLKLWILTHGFKKLRGAAGHLRYAIWNSGCRISARILNSGFWRTVSKN
jgi:hypothetical protein